MGIPRERRMNSGADYEAVERLYDSPGGSVISSSVSKFRTFNYTYTQDELNEMALLGNTSYDIGGNFLSLRAEAEFTPIVRYAKADLFGLRWELDGPITAYPVAYWGSDVSNSTWESNVYASVGLDSLPERIGMGATAISRCRPSQPQASLGVSIVEMLREGIPHSLRQLANMKDEISKFRDLSLSQKGRTAPSKFLESEFGWKPLLNDIRDSSRAIVQYDRILSDLRRNSGKRMRRRYTFPDTTSSVEYARDSTHPWPNPIGYIVGQAGPRVITISSTKRTWFAGEFVYTYPSEDAAIPLQIVAGARQLLGIDLTPETIWNLAPWTWLADWFANVGDVVANFTAIGSDNLLMRYGYLMQEAKQTWLHQHFGVSIPSEGISGVTLSGTFTQSAKTRIGASPFGFGLSSQDLDARQIAILASIGFTRNVRR